MLSHLHGKCCTTRQTDRLTDGSTGRLTDWFQARRNVFVSGVTTDQLYCLCIDVAVCSMALQCICRVIRRGSMTMKAHILHNFGRPPIGGKLLPLPPSGGATGVGYKFVRTLYDLVSGGFRGGAGVRPHPPWRPSEKFMVYQFRKQ